MHNPRIILCALVAGLLVAASLGANVSSHGDADGATMQTAFSPAFTLIGFLLGAPIGGAVGFLWGRSGFLGALLLVAPVGGLIGLMIAAWLGAETHVTRTDTGMSMTHGPSPGILVVGAVLGTVFSVLCAWRFRPEKRTALPV